jgi:uncharacterized protein Yka (UPF0111/DUF47 family)
MLTESHLYCVWFFWYLLLAQLIRVALITLYRHVGQNAGKKDDKKRESDLLKKYISLNIAENFRLPDRFELISSVITDWK